MRISFLKREFAEAVHIASRFVEKGGAAMPALSSILIVAGGDGIKLRATNLETGIEITVSGDKKEDGVVAIPGSVLREITASLTGDGEVSLEHAGDTAVLTTSAGKSTVKTVPYEDFPIIPLPESKKSLTLPGVTIKNLFTSIASCASTSTVRPELSSILLSVEGGTLTAVATDSFRLVEKRLALGKSVEPAKILIPAKNALDLAQALPDAEVKMTYDDHQASFFWDKGRVVTRLTNANYPDYKQIIPKDVTVEAVVLKKDFELALRRVTVFSDSFQKIKIDFDPKKKALSFFARNPDIGESAESMNAQITGVPLELSFNHRYLSAAPPLTGAESLTLSAAGVGRPLVIRGVGDNSFLYLVSPMNQ